ncbi:MAG: A24 family peptidase C-terminal domain-containing protein, partial [Candidatus Jordarchaeaceae archaeon]
ELVTTIFSVIVSLIISLPLYTIKIFGGADTKATIFVSLLIPKNISASFTPFFPLTLFLNIFAILGVLYLIILSYNLIGRLVRGSLFPGLESESKWRKMLALLTCIQSDLNSIHTKKHFYPVQQITEKDGKIEMHLIPPRRALDNTSTLKLLKSKVNHLPSNRIWVYFKKPLMPIILISVIISFFLGDLPMFLLNFF